MKLNFSFRFLMQTCESALNCSFNWYKKHFHSEKRLSSLGLKVKKQIKLLHRKYMYIIKGKDSFVLFVFFCSTTCLMVGWNSGLCRLIKEFESQTIPSHTSETATSSFTSRCLWVYIIQKNRKLLFPECYWDCI